MERWLGDKQHLACGAAETNGGLTVFSIWEGLHKRCWCGAWGYTRYKQHATSNIHAVTILRHTERKVGTLNFSQ